MKDERIYRLQRRAVQLRGELEEAGPVIFGTIAAKTQKSRHFDRVEKYLRSKYKAHFTEDGMKHWGEEAAKAWKYLDARRRHMNYVWLHRHGCLIGSGHIESACKVIIGQRCKGAGMHWRYMNAIYVSVLRARMRSAA